MTNPDIAIVINSFNRFYLLQKCLKVLSQWIKGSVFDGKVVAVIYEAGSKDGSIEWLMGNNAVFNFPIEIIVAQPGEDNSFSAGLNIGVENVLRKFDTIKYLLFYETDNQILSADPLEKALVQLKESSRLGACGFTVRKVSGNMAGVGMPFPKLSNFLLGKNVVHKFNLESIKFKWEKTKTGSEFSKIDIVFTSPLLVKKEAWVQSGGLDALTFPFSDCDLDWGLRMKQCGWEMGVIKTSEVIHDNLETVSEWSKGRELQSHRGRFRFFKKHHPRLLYLIWPQFLLVRHCIEYIAAKTLVRDKEKRKRLSSQYLTLLKSCSNGYNQKI